MTPTTAIRANPDEGQHQADPESRVAAIAEVVSAASDEIEASRRLTPAVLQALHDNNLFRMLLPRRFGGDEVDPMTFSRTMRALAALDASTAWCVGQGNGCSMCAAYVDPAVAKTMWGDDQTSVLAWGPGKAEVTEDDGGYRITGGWRFASGSRHASWLGCMTPMPGVTDRSQVRTMLVPADMVVMEDVWDTIGLRGTGTDSYTVEDLYVPVEFSTRRDNPEDRREDGPLYKLTSSALYSIGFASTAMGVATAMLDEFRDLATVKTPLRMSGNLRDNQVVQADYAVSRARVGAAHAFLLSECADVWDQIHRDGEASMESRVRIRLATTFGIHEAKEAANFAYDLSGATAVFRSNGVERRFRDIHTITQQIQGRKDHLQTSGAFMLGLPANVGSL